jgi:hypothetical protein
MKHLAEVHGVHVLVQLSWSVHLLHLTSPGIDHVINLLLRISLAVELIGQSGSDLICQIVATANTSIGLIPLIVLVLLQLN